MGMTSGRRNLPMLSTRAFWVDDAARPEGLGDDSLPTRTDVAIVGSGYTGLNAARSLRRQGADVVVLDAGEIAGGASSVNGGFVTNGLKAANEAIFAAYGPELGREFWAASLAAIDEVERVVTDEGIECDFHRPGVAGLGFTRRDVSGLNALRDWEASELGFVQEIVTGDRLRAEITDSPRFTVALVDGVSGAVHPARYAFGLAQAVHRRGARLVARAAVTAIERQGASYRVRTGRGTLLADEVLVATNGYTERLVPHLRRGVVPVGSYIVATEPLGAERAAALVPGGHVLWTNRRFLHYFRLTPDNRLLMGGRNNLSTSLDLVESARRLRATIEHYYPQLTGVGITHSWTGRLAVTFDLMPHIGRVDGVWYALGYGGHGVGVATYVGREVGGLIGGELARSPFAEIPHPTRWFYRHRPWFLPAAARLYRMLDAFGR